MLTVDYKSPTTAGQDLRKRWVRRYVAGSCVFAAIHGIGSILLASRVYQNPYETYWSYTPIPADLVRLYELPLSLIVPNMASAGFPEQQFAIVALVNAGLWGLLFVAMCHGTTRVVEGSTTVLKQVFRKTRSSK